MPAYKIPIHQLSCAEAGCKKRPAWLVRSAKHAAMGEFCTAHADEWVADLNSARSADRAHRAAPAGEGSAPAKSHGRAVG